MEWIQASDKLPPNHNPARSAVVMVSNGKDIGFAYYDYEKSKWYGGFDSDYKEYIPKNHILAWKY